MEHIFGLAERLVFNCKREFTASRNQIGNYFFESALIKNSSFEIVFTDNTTTIICELSTHPLDTPWSINMKLRKASEELSLNHLLSEVRKDNGIYEVYPNLLKDPSSLGNQLAVKIAFDLVEYLKSNNLPKL